MFGEDISLGENSEGGGFGGGVLGLIGSGEMKDIWDSGNLIKGKKVYKGEGENKEV